MRALRVTALPLAVLLLCTCLLAQDKDYEVLEAQKVYYGDCDSFESPASVVSASVFPHTKPYKLIKEKELTEKDPEYWVLLHEANKVFRHAVKAVAASFDYDLVAESGAVKPAAEDVSIPDITPFVIAQVKRNPEGQ